MRKRIPVLTLVLTLCTAPPVGAFFGISPDDLLIWLVLRPKMHRNQDAMIANQVLELQEMVAQLQTAQEQLQHVQDASQGLIGAIDGPIRDLIATPRELFDRAPVWADDFTGPATGVVDAVQDMRLGTSFRASWQDLLDAAPPVTGETVRASYAGQPAEVAEAAAAAWRDRQDDADARLVQTHAQAAAGAHAQRMGVSASAAIAGLAERLDAVDPLTGTENRSGSALREADALAALTQVEVLIARAQALTVRSAVETSAQYGAEIARRERGAMHAAERLANAAALEAQLQAIEAQRDARERGLRFRLHPLYGGTN